MNQSDLKANSYVPYSGKQAICVVESSKGHYFPGVRVENIVYPLTIDEVQNALFTCLSEGEQPQSVYVENPEDHRLNFWGKEYRLSLQPLDRLEEVVFRPVILSGDDLSETDLLETLLDQAIALNSGFPVSALLKTDLGIVTGVNIECSEWNLGLCAERVALAKAIACGVKKFQALYVHTRYGEFSSPCGACRQVIIEHMPRHPVHLYHADYTHSVHHSSDLLPYSFRSSTLKQPQS